MKIELKRLNDAFHLQAQNESGNTIDMDASPQIGGENKGMRPMELLVSAIGACSTIDIIDILKKQRQDLKDILITVEAEREPDKTPSLFTKIHVHYKLFGNIEASKAERAIKLSLETYCSVAKILEKTAEISSSFEIEIFENPF
jgi:putative redox protein